MSEEQPRSMQPYYVESKRPRYRIYVMLLIIGIIAVTAFVFTATESGVDAIEKKYSERAQPRSDSDAENVAHAMQLIFSETGLVLDDVGGILP